MESSQELLHLRRRPEEVIRRGTASWFPHEDGDPSPSPHSFEAGLIGGTIPKEENEVGSASG